MSILQKSRTKASARVQINIRGVRDGVLLLPRKQYRAVLEVSPVNFELKSEDEQDALIDTYESFLNSLPCQLQILVRIRELDMDNYLADLATREAAEEESIYKEQLRHYSSFVQRLVVNNRILSRHFYVVLPYRATDDDFDAVKEQLGLNIDMVSKGLARMGMRARQLTNLEILDLFHTFYNPAQAKQQPLSERVASFVSSTYIRSQHD